MAQAANNSSVALLKPFTSEDDVNLRESLKRCSAATYEAAYRGVPEIWREVLEGRVPPTP